MTRVTYEHVREAMGGRAQFPCACPGCGWDAAGELECVDRYATDYPPIPWMDLRQIVADPESGGILFCPECDHELDPDTVVERPREDD